MVDRLIVVVVACVLQGQAGDELEPSVNDVTG